MDKLQAGEQSSLLRWKGGGGGGGGGRGKKGSGQRGRKFKCHENEKS